MGYPSQSSTEPKAVLVEPRGPMASDVWLRRDIVHDVADMQDGQAVDFWRYEEVHGVMGGHPSEDEVAARFDELWDAFELDELTDRAMAMRALDAAEAAQAQADYTAIMTETEVGDE